MDVRHQHTREGATVKNDQHWEDVDRLWRALRRDLGTAILEGAGVRDGQTLVRILSTWERLCEVDLDVAAGIYHGMQQITMAMARHGQVNSPSAHHLGQLSEQVGLAEIGRAKHPEAGAETVGDLIALGEVAIRSEIDAETGDEGQPEQ